MMKFLTFALVVVLLIFGHQLFFYLYPARPMPSKETGEMTCPFGTSLDESVEFPICQSLVGGYFLRVTTRDATEFEPTTGEIQQTEEVPVL